MDMRLQNSYMRGSDSRMSSNSFKRLKLFPFKIIDSFLISAELTGNCHKVAEWQLQIDGYTDIHFVN
jgi:hypothetical protein